jgi:hypothetical protein
LLVHDEPLAVVDALAVREAILAAYGGGASMIDERKLESALMRPRMAAHYEGANIFRQTVASDHDGAVGHLEEWLRTHVELA